LAERAVKTLFSCEHAGNRLPERFRGRFKGSEDILASHRGFDAGAWELARFMAAASGVRGYPFPWTRLLIDANRSLTHRSLFSEISGKWPQSEKSFLIESLYLPYRTSVENEISGWIRHGAIVSHLSLHTFTPSMHGRIRAADAGLLYDPSRHHEKRFCDDWRRLLGPGRSRLRIRMNYPYRGVSDGLVPSLRKKLPGPFYIGLELEVNQKWVFSERQKWNRLKKDLSETFLLAVGRFSGPAEPKHT
jgi:predicted N-formylglutamate amidohydrolase